MIRLIQHVFGYCPVKIKDIYSRLKGTPITASKMKEIKNDNGDIIIYAGGKTVVKALETEIPKANITRVPAVLIQSRGVIDAIYCEEPFTFKNEMWAYTNDNEITVKYLYYVIKNSINFFRKSASVMGSLPQISISTTEDYIFNLPSIEEQEKIVSILDRFDSLCNDIASGLPAEIEARQKQYEYYRDKLLNFE
ncbi:restriction endonuclease subunit S [Enterococcus cecorum]